MRRELIPSAALVDIGFPYVHVVITPSGIAPNHLIVNSACVAVDLDSFQQTQFSRGLLQKAVWAELSTISQKKAVDIA